MVFVIFPEFDGFLVYVGSKSSQSCFLDPCACQWLYCEKYGADEKYCGRFRKPIYHLETGTSFIGIAPVTFENHSETFEWMPKFGAVSYTHLTLPTNREV